MWVFRVCGVSLLAVCSAVPSRAQQPSSGRGPLEEILTAGDPVKVTVRQGLTYEGELRQLSVSGLQVEVTRCHSAPLSPVGGWDPRSAPVSECPEDVTLGLNDVRTISRAYRDGIADGALIGFGGVGAFSFLLMIMAGGDEGSGDLTRLWIKLSLAGAGAGALIDGLVGGWEEVYRSGREEGVGLAVAPFIQRSRVGAAVSLHFR